MTTQLGKAARTIREKKNLTQTTMARMLEITQVHLSNFENGKSKPSLELIEKYKTVFGIDLNMIAWCLFGEIETLPKKVQASARRFQLVWKKHVENQLENTK